MLRAVTRLHRALSVTWVTLCSVYPPACVYVKHSVFTYKWQHGVMVLATGWAGSGRAAVPISKEKNGQPTRLAVSVRDLEIEVEIVKNRKFLSVPYPSSPSRAVLSACLSSRLKVFVFLLRPLYKLQVLANSCAGQHCSHCCCMLQFCEIGHI